MINVYYNYFVTEKIDRNNELLYCFEQLINNKNIDRCFMFISKNDLKQYNKEKFGKNKKKVTIIKNGRPTYGDLFNEATINSDVNDINIFINSDCFLDESDTKKLLEMPDDECYCLSRFNILSFSPFKLDSTQIKRNSQDCWIFKGKPKEIFGDYNMGVKSCDNVVAYELLKAGYNLKNIPYDIRVYHYHLSDRGAGGNWDTRLEWKDNNYDHMHRYQVGLIKDGKVVDYARYEPPNWKKDQLITKPISIPPFNKILKETVQFRPKANYPIYPPYHEGNYIEEYFFNYYVENKIQTERTYLPIFWTNLYNNEIFSKEKFELQSYLDTLDPKARYFTVCQHEAAPREILPKNTLIFSASGKIQQAHESNNHIPIPLLCSPFKNPIVNKKRDIFCSFVGAKTHKLRESLFNNFKDDPEFYFNMDSWKINIPKHKEDEFKDITERSIFTLCPRGEGPTSFRLYEAMQLGSIPVYVHDLSWLPNEDEINWKDICILITENQIPHLKGILKHISDEKIIQMKKNIKRTYAKYFTFEKMSEKIINKLSNEKTKLLTFYTDSHQKIYENYFKPSVDFFNEYNLIAYKSKQIGENGTYFEPGWRESMLQKLRFIAKTINECWGEYFVFSDVDVIFFQKTKDFLMDEVKNIDASFQKDYTGLCAGFFIMRCNEKTLKFINFCIDSYKNHPESDDQGIMNIYVEKMIHYKLLPTKISNISHINNNSTWLGNYDLKIPDNILIFHANWTVGLENKINLLNFSIDSLKHKRNFSKFKISTEKKIATVFSNGVIFTGIIDNNRIVRGEYIKNKFIPINISSVAMGDARISKIKTNVFFNYFKSKQSARDSEILFCLDKLIENEKIDNIFLLCSDNINIHNNKIVKIDFNSERPTFKDFFNIVNFNSEKNDVNIILNSDCFIDETNVKIIKDNLTKNQAYCLSRWNINNLKTFSAQHYNIECSQDAWIFIGQISEKINGDYKIGLPGCDNAIAFEFEKVGYEVSNPSLDIKIYHVHLTDFRTYNEENRIKLPYKFVPACTLKEPPKVKISKSESKTILEIPPEMSGKELKQYKEENQHLLDNIKQEEIKSVEIKKEPPKENGYHGMQRDGGIRP